MRWLDFYHDDREYKQFANTCYQEAGLFSFGKPCGPAFPLSTR